MPTPSKTLRFWAEAVFLFVLNTFSRILPLRWVSLPGDWLGWAIYDLIRYKRKLTLRNLELALGETCSAKQRVVVGRRCYRFFGGVAMEILAMEHIPRQNLDEFLVLDNPEVIDSPSSDQKTSHRKVKTEAGRAGRLTENSAERRQDRPNQRRIRLLATEKGKRYV